MPGIELIVRAVVRRGDFVLLARERGSSWYFLPGGHVEHGEPVEAALVREIREELGTPAAVGVFRGAVEHQYGQHHEINLVFEVRIDDAEPSSREDHLEFLWLPASVGTADVRPAPIADLLVSPGGAPVWSGFEPG
jgi:8-oxo-dGTP diphosphatase